MDINVTEKVAEIQFQFRVKMYYTRHYNKLNAF